MTEIFTLFRDTAFGPEELQAMGDAFDAVKKALPEKDPYEIAAIILRNAKADTFDAAALCARTLDELSASKFR